MMPSMMTFGNGDPPRPPLERGEEEELGIGGVVVSVVAPTKTETKRLITGGD